MNILDAVETVVDRRPDALYVSALGTVTAALRSVSHDGPHLYFGGAMGSAAAAALGVAERVAPRLVVALVGDGEMLMSVRTLWSIAGLHPENLLIVVMVDGRYAMTGGQRIEAAVTFAEAAAALPGIHAVRAASRTELAHAVDEVGLPGLIEAMLDDQVKPAASPFVDPHKVRLAFQAEVARGVSDDKAPGLVAAAGAGRLAGGPRRPGVRA
jgi:thiamine pyrophosphate-dependent acetolactate synthase large subunit-like protein